MKSELTLGVNFRLLIYVDNDWIELACNVTNCSAYLIILPISKLLPPPPPPLSEPELDEPEAPDSECDDPDDDATPAPEFPPGR